MDPGETQRKDRSDHESDSIVPNQLRKAPSALLDGHDLGDCNRLCRHRLLRLPMDGRVPGTILLINEAAMKTWVFSALFPLVILAASFARAAESNDSIMAYAVFYVS